MSLTQSLLKDPAVENWLNNLAKSTQRVQRNYFKHFIKWVRENGGEFAGATPTDLVEYQKKHKNYEILDKLVKPFIRSKKGTYNTKTTRYTNIRSFFLHNRAELPQDAGFNLRPERHPVQGTLTAEEIKKVILSCNPVYAAVYMCMFQAALDAEMFTYWNTHGWDSLNEQLRENPEIIKIELPGRKGKKNISPYYTFIGKDAVEKVKAWLKIRAERVKKGKIDPDENAIFCSMYGTPMTKRSLRSYWLSHLRKLALVEPVKKGSRLYRTGKNLHEMRDVFRSLWSKSPASHIVGEYCMGHTIDKLEYDKSWRDEKFYRREYLKASSYLNLLSSHAPYDLVETDQVERLKKELEQAKKGQNTEFARLEKKLEQTRQEQLTLMKKITQLVEDSEKLKQ